MRKIFTLIILLLSFSAVNAQYRFYAGLQAGPKLSFSNLILPDGQDLNFKSCHKIRHQEGIVVGYNFRNERFSIEGGFSHQTHAVTIRFPDSPVYGKAPDLGYNFVGNQISLLGKMTLNNPASKFKVRAVIGGAYFMKRWQPHGDFYTDQEIEKDGFVSYPYKEGTGYNFGISPPDFVPVVPSTALLFQVGFEAQLKLNKHLTIGLSAIYQNRFHPVEVTPFEYTYNYDRSAVYEPIQQGSATSKAEAINLNLGLTYGFGKRKN